MFQISNHLNALHRLIFTEDLKFTEFSHYLRVTLMPLVSLARRFPESVALQLAFEFDYVKGWLGRFNHKSRGDKANLSDFCQDVLPLLLLRIENDMDVLADYQLMGDSAFPEKVCYQLMKGMVKAGRTVDDERVQYLLSIAKSPAHYGLVKNRYIVLLIENSSSIKQITALLRDFSYSKITSLEIYAVIKALFEKQQADLAKRFLNSIRSASFSAPLYEEGLCIYYRTLRHYPALIGDSEATTQSLEKKIVAAEAFHQSRAISTNMAELLVAIGDECSGGNEQYRCVLLADEFRRWTNACEDDSPLASFLVAHDGIQLSSSKIKYMLPRIRSTLDRQSLLRASVGIFSEEILHELDFLAITPGIREAMDSQEQWLLYAIDFICMDDFLLLIQKCVESTVPDGQSELVAIPLIDMGSLLTTLFGQSRIHETGGGLDHRIKLLFYVYVRLLLLCILYVPVDQLRPICQQVLDAMPEKYASNMAVLFIKGLVFDEEVELDKDGQIQLEAVRLQMACQTAELLPMAEVDSHYPLPMWLIAQAGQYLPQERQALCASYQLFYQRIMQINDNLSSEMERHRFNVGDIAIDQQQALSQLVAIMGGDCFAYLVDHYAAFTAMPIVMFLDEMAELPTIVIEKLNYIYRKFRAEINVGEAWKDWTAIMSNVNAAVNCIVLEDSPGPLLEELVQNLDDALAQDGLSACLESVNTIVFNKLCSQLGMSKCQTRCADQAAYEGETIASSSAKILYARAQLAKRALSDEGRFDDASQKLAVMDAMLRNDLGATELENESSMRAVIAHNQKVREQLATSGADPGMVTEYSRVMEFTYHPGEGSNSKVIILHQYEVIWRYLLKLLSVVDDILEDEASQARLSQEFISNVGAIKRHVAHFEEELGIVASEGNRLTASQVGLIKSNEPKLNKMLAAVGFLKRNCQQELEHFKQVDEFVEHLHEANLRLLELKEEVQKERSGAEESKKTSEEKVSRFRVEFLRKSDPAFFYVGNEVGCCLATNNAQFMGIVERRMDDALMVPVVRDVKTGKVVALAWLYLADDKSALMWQGTSYYVVANFLEINAGYASDPGLRGAIVQALLHYVGQWYARDIGANFMIAPLSYGNIPDFECFEQAHECEFALLGSGVKFAGGDSGGRGHSYFLESLLNHTFHSYDALSAIGYQPKLEQLIAQFIEKCTDASDVWSGIRDDALRYAREQFELYYMVEGGQEALDALLMEAEQSGNEIVNEYMSAKQEAAAKEAASARAVREVGVCMGGGVAVPAASLDILQKV